MSENEEISETRGKEQERKRRGNITTNEDDNYHFIIFPKDTQKRELVLSGKMRVEQHTARLPY